MSSLNKLSSWIDIGNHFKKISDKSLNEMFKEDKDRFNKFSIDKVFPWMRLYNFKPNRCV